MYVIAEYHPKKHIENSFFQKDLLINVNTHQNEKGKGPSLMYSFYH